MIAIILRGLGSIVVTTLVVSILTFLLFFTIPNGDPAQRIAGKHAPASVVEEVRRELHLDQPVWVQYRTMMGKLLCGELTSYNHRLDVVDEIRDRLPVTFSLAFGAAVLWIALSLVIGLYGALFRGKLLDRVLTQFALLGVSTPMFLLAAVSIYYLEFKAGLFPSSGYVPFSESPIRWAHHLVLPWSALAFLYVGIHSRVIRARVLENLDQGFVRTAYAKGLTRRRRLFCHVIPNSLLGVISLWGLEIGVVVGGGAIVTETVFGLHGVGEYAARAVVELDTPVALAVTIFGATSVVTANAVATILQSLLDPRVRSAR